MTDAHGTDRLAVAANHQSAKDIGSGDGDEGYQHLSDKTAPKRSKPAVAVKTQTGADQTPGNRPDRAIDHVSASLRRAYQSTLEESVPDSIMDLLRKLD